jgi:hypothetical protein
MSGEQRPVLTLDFSDEKIQKLQAIADQFKNAPGGKPGGGSLPVPPRSPGRIPGKSPANSFMQELNKEAKGTLKTFTLINKTLKLTTSTLKGLFSMTISWGAKLAALAVGGPFGFNLLARHTTQQFMAAQGLNMSIGQVQAAHNVYGNRFSSTDSVMQTLSDAQRNPGSKEYRAVMALGLNPTDDPGSNLPKYFSAIEQVRKQYGNNALQYLHGLGLNTTAADLNQSKANSQDIPLMGRQYQAQSKSLDNSLSPATQRSYQDTTTALSFSADKLMNSFKTAISNLNGPIMQMTDGITKNINGFLTGPNGAAVFKTIGDGLNKFATWLNSKQFQTDMDDFARKIGKLAKEIGKVIDWISNIIGDDDSNDSSPAAGSPQGSTSTSDLLKQLWRGKYATPGDAAMAVGRTISGVADNLFFNDMRNRAIGNSKISAAGGPLHALVDAASKANALPGGMMSAIVGAESSWNPLAKGKPDKNGKYAKGMWQFWDSTAAQYGLKGDDVYDPNKSTAAAGRYLHHLSKIYHGDVAKMLTSYNGGKVTKDGNLNLNMETVKYLEKLIPQIDGAQQQHPYIMHQLKASEEYLERAPKGSRSTIHLIVDQKPGSDIGVQVAGVGIPH